MSMKLGITGGNLEITDDNKTVVSSNIAKEINDNYIQSEDKEEPKSPDLTIKD